MGPGPPGAVWGTRPRALTATCGPPSLSPRRRTSCTKQVCRRCGRPPGWCVFRPRGSRLEPCWGSFLNRSHHRRNSMPFTASGAPGHTGARSALALRAAGQGLSGTGTEELRLSDSLRPPRCARLLVGRPALRGPLLGAAHLPALQCLYCPPGEEPLSSLNGRLSCGASSPLS